MSEASIRPMTEQDYDAVRALWLTIRGFGIRALDDSREDVVRFIGRNPTTSVVAEMEGTIIGSTRLRGEGLPQAGHRHPYGGLLHAPVKRNGHQ